MEGTCTSMSARHSTHSSYLGDLASHLTSCLQTGPYLTVFCKVCVRQIEGYFHPCNPNSSYLKMPKKSLNSVFPMNTIQNTAVSECYLTEMRSDRGWCKILIIKPWKHWALWFQVSSWPFCFCHLRSYKSNPVLSTEGIPTLPAFICHQIPSLHVSFHINSMGCSISICIPLLQSFKWQLMIYLKRSSHVNKVPSGFPFHCIDYKPLTGCMWSGACQPLLSPSSLSSQIHVSLSLCTSCPPCLGCPYPRSYMLHHSGPH